MSKLACKHHWRLTDSGLFKTKATSAFILLPDLWQTRLLQPLLQSHSWPVDIVKSELSCQEALGSRNYQRQKRFLSLKCQHWQQRRWAHQTSNSLAARPHTVKHVIISSKTIHGLSGSINDTTKTEKTDKLMEYKSFNKSENKNDDLGNVSNRRITNAALRKNRAIIRNRLNPPGINQNAARTLARAFNEAMLNGGTSPLMDVSAQLDILHQSKLNLVDSGQVAADRVWLQFQRATIVPKVLRQMPIQTYTTLIKHLANGKPTTEAARRLRIVLNDILQAPRVLKKSEWNATLHAFAICSDLASMERVWQLMRSFDSATSKADTNNHNSKLAKPALYKNTPDIYYLQGHNCMLKQSTIYNNSSYIKNVTNEKTHAHWLTAYNTRLQAYTQQGALKAVEYVWKEMLDHPGLAPNRMSWNTRINAHARFGDVDDMEQYAKDMAILHRIKWDAYTQQALLVGYGRAGRWDAVARIRGILEQREALRITSNIKYDKCMLQQEAHQPNALPSKKTDEQSAFSFPTPNVHTYTALMSLQIEKKDYIGAGRTLRWMLSAGIQPTQATVNVILRLHIEQQDLLGAIRIFDQLMSQRAADPDNWHPNAHTVAILIDACSRYGAYEEMHRIRQIVVALGVRFTIATLTALAIGYAKAGRSQDARQFATQAREAALNESSHSRPLSKEVIFNASLRSDGAINTAERARGGSRVAEAISLCCAVIRALGDANCPDGAQAVWQDLLHSGLPLGADEHNTWLYVLGKRKDFHTLRLCYYERVMALFPRDTLEQSIDDSNELFTHVVRGPPANVKTFAIMIHIMATYGKIGLAEYLYQQLLWLADLSPYLHFWKTQSNSDNGLYKPRLQLVAQDHANIFSILVSARLRRNDDEGAYDQYHQLAPSLKAALSVPIYTALMDAAARKKRWSRLYALLNDMLANGHSLDTKAYNVLLRAHTAGKNYDAVLDCMEIMKERGNDMAPDARTFAIVITAAIRHQRHDLVWSWLKELGDPNAYTEQAPNTASESPILCNQVLATEIIRWYAMNGNLPAAEAAYQRIQQLPANKVNSKRPIIPDITARHTLLSAYARQGDIVNAARIYKEFKADGFKPTSQTFAILLTCCRRSIARQLISLRENDAIERPFHFPTDQKTVRLPMVLEIWRQMLEAGVNPDVHHACRAIFSADSPMLLTSIIRTIRLTPVCDSQTNTAAISVDTVTVNPLLESLAVQQAIAETAHRVGWV